MGESPAHGDVGYLPIPAQRVEPKRRSYEGTRTWLIGQRHAHLMNPFLTNGHRLSGQSCRHLAKKGTNILTGRTRAELDAPVR